MLLPSVTYRCECELQSVDEGGAADSVRVFVCNRTSKLPIISAVVAMPISEAVMPD